MSPRRRLLLIGGGVLAAAVVIGVVVAANGGSDGASSSTDGKSSPTTVRGNGKGAATTARGGGKGTGSTATPGSGTGGPPPKASGVVNADTDAKYGQSPSSGTCAHWSERFINNSTVRVVQITFAPSHAFYARGKKGQSSYKEFPAKAPVPAVLNVAIAPKAAQEIQFMACTDTAPPSGPVELHIDVPKVLRWKWENGANGTNEFP